MLDIVNKQYKVPQTHYTPALGSGQCRTSPIHRLQHTLDAWCIGPLTVWAITPASGVHSHPKWRKEGRNYKFYKVLQKQYSIFTSHCNEFVQDTVYQTASELAEFYKIWQKAFWCVWLSSQHVYVCSYISHFFYLFVNLFMSRWVVAFVVCKFTSC